MANIEMHADVCASQFDPIGTVNPETELKLPGDENLNLLCLENPSQSQITSDKNSDNDTDSEDDNASNSLRGQIKQTVAALQTNVDQNVNRLSVRRRYAFQDYLAARRKPRRRFNPNGMLKISFIGEPAIDDGGQRREFYSGYFYNRPFYRTCKWIEGHNKILTYKKQAPDSRTMNITSSKNVLEGSQSHVRCVTSESLFGSL